MAHRSLRLGGMLIAATALLVPPAFASLPTPAFLAAYAALPSRAGATGEGHHTARYNFPPPSRGDRFARRGLNYRVGIEGWRRFGTMIKHQANARRIDPFVVGAYIWLESEFDPRQDYARGARRAIGLGSVQATEHPHLTLEQLMDPKRNVSLTVHEFARKWHPHDMRATVMDVWYPAWRGMVAQGRPLPVIRTPEVYVQAIANRYYALREIDQHLRPARPFRQVERPAAGQGEG